MTNKNSASPSGFSSSRLRIAGLWVSAVVALNFVAVLAQSLGAASATIDSKVSQCGPIGDTIEYLMWLLRQL
ncbi:MAG: hypothetical protein ACREJD_13470 [Phycisphaerales bacterium]